MYLLYQTWAKTEAGLIKEINLYFVRFKEVENNHYFVSGLKKFNSFKKLKKYV